MSEQQTVLTPEVVQQIINAQVRLKELGGDSAIINPRSEAEINGLKKFLGDSFLTYGAEFVGCWVCIQQEYDPLVTTLERMFNRVLAINNRRQLARAQEQKP